MRLPRWYRQQLRQVRRARRQAKAQPRARLTLELAGFGALTLHPVTGRLTVPIERELGAPVADTLREAWRERRRARQTEAAQLRRDGGENAYRQGHAPLDPALVPTSSPTADPTGSAPLPPATQAAQN